MRTEPRPDKELEGSQGPVEKRHDSGGGEGDADGGDATGMNRFHNIGVSI
jgi:hypothetical protein